MSSITAIKLQFNTWKKRRLKTFFTLSYI